MAELSTIVHFLLYHNTPKLVNENFIKSYMTKTPTTVGVLHSYSSYLRLTSAPSASSLALISSASALETASFTTFGASSTTALASFSPRPVISRTTLITLTLEAPADTNSTSNGSLTVEQSQKSFRPYKACIFLSNFACGYCVILRDVL